MFQQISIKQYRITLIPSTTFEIHVHVFKFITKKQWLPYLGEYTLD